MKNKNSYLYRIVVKKENLTGKKIILPILKMLSYIYAGVIKLRVFIYKTGIFKSYGLPVPVISIGNISVGGSGKTVFTQTIGNLIKNKFDKKPAVLLRGYGAEVKDFSDDRRKKIDEEVVLRKNLHPAPILVERNRIKTGREAVEKYHADCVILDDGFQYLKLKRDLNIVLIKPHTILREHFLLPRGLLREPFSHLSRADMIVVTDIDRITENNIRLIRQYLKNSYPSKSILFAYYSPFKIYNVRKDKEVKIEELKCKELISFSGIGDPESFSHSLKKQNFDIKNEIIYEDHYNYKVNDVKNIIKTAKKSGVNNLITTQKDVCKILPYLDEFKSQNVNLYVMKIKLELAKKEFKKNLYDELYNLLNS